jgi:CBS domain-containing protein
MGLKQKIKNVMRLDWPKVDGNLDVREAIETMAEHGVCAVSVEKDGTVLGIVTDLDLVGAIVRHGDPAKIKVADCMTACELITGSGAKKPCVQLDQDETVENALKLLDGAGVHNVMIAGKDDRCFGIISAGELLKAAIS